MIKNRKLEFMTIVAVTAFIIIFLAISSGGMYDFAGSDNAGSDKVAELTGHPIDSFKPLIPQYKPISGEIEATLFALQASFGGLILGIVIGYWLGRKKSVSST